MALPINLVVGSSERQVVLARTDGKIGDGARISLDVKRLQGRKEQGAATNDAMAKKK